MAFNLLIGGEAGQGLVSMENELLDCLFRLGYRAFAAKNYMSRIRGGHNFHMVRVSDVPVHALAGDGWDMVVALDEETEKRHVFSLRSGGLLLDRDRMAEIAALAREDYGEVLAGNALLAGMVLRVLGCGLDVLRQAGFEPSRQERLLAGFRLAEREGWAGRFPVAAGKGMPYRFDGNSALALGSLLGGCQFMSSYPMTPATSVMTYFANVAQELPIHFEQAEDEISAINMALGASYAGLRSMVATSGGGFALMQEGVSLAGMTETPLVILEAQRPGPATGLPTRTEQGDLNFVLHAGHGEFPRLIYAPGSVEEALALARRAFSMADRYQIPVFLLTDQYFSDSVHFVDTAINTAVDIREYAISDPEYRRYRLTEDGISPLASPGHGKGRVKVDSDEHGEDGTIAEDPALRVRMMDKRRGKLALLQRDAEAPSGFGDTDAPVLAVCWGSTKAVVQEAVEGLCRQGHAIGGLHFSQVYPLADDMSVRYALAQKRLYVVENNAGGQFAALMRREWGIEAAGGILKYNGEPFTVAEVAEALLERLRGEGR